MRAFTERQNGSLLSADKDPRVLQACAMLDDKELSVARPGTMTSPCDKLIPR